MKKSKKSKEAVAEAPAEEKKDSEQQKKEEEKLARDAEFGEEAWTARGKPLFTRLWTYEELLTVERPPGPGRAQRSKTPQHVMEKPANWPIDVEPDPGTWVFWLPDGWAQGIRTQASSGKTLKCYMSPAGKRYWHKKDIERDLGYALPTVEPVRKKVDEEGKEQPRVRYVTDPDVIPTWPEWDIPKDFRIAFKQLPTGPHKIYIPPGSDDGFLFHRTCVEQYLSTGKKLTQFASSRMMSEIMAEAAEKGTSKVLPNSEGEFRPKKKRKTMPNVRIPLHPEDYEPEQVRVLEIKIEPWETLNKQLHGEGVPQSEDVAVAAGKFSALLKKQKFDLANLICVFSRAEEPHKFINGVCGFYYQRPEYYNERAYYQRMFEAPDGQIGCSPLFLFWNASQTRWQISRLNVEAFGYAVCYSSQSNPAVPGWAVLKRDWDSVSPKDSNEKNDTLAGESVEMQVESSTSDSKDVSLNVSNSSVSKSHVEKDLSDQKEELPTETTTKPAAPATKENDAYEKSKRSLQAQNEGVQVETKTKPAASADTKTKPAVPATMETGAHEKSKPAAQEQNEDLDGFHMEKVWTWPDLEEKERWRMDVPKEPPPHWPEGIDVSESKVPWLPDGWGQGKKFRGSGPIAVFISPTGIVRYNKKEVEKDLGRSIENIQTDAPAWPSWLPKNWAITRRAKLVGTGEKQTVFLTPGGERFLYSKTEVDKYINGDLGKQRKSKDGEVLGRLRLPPEVMTKLAAVANLQ